MRFWPWRAITASATPVSSTRRRTISIDCSTAPEALARRPTSVSVAVTVPSGAVVTSISGWVVPTPAFTWLASSRIWAAAVSAWPGSRTRKLMRRFAGSAARLT